MDRIEDPDLFQDKNLRCLMFYQDGVQVIRMNCMKITGDPWEIMIMAGGKHNPYTIPYNGRWDKDKVFDLVLNTIHSDRKARMAVFQRIFE